jgi:hypothetical protein
MQFDELTDETFLTLLRTFGVSVNYKRKCVEGPQHTLVSIKAIPVHPQTPLERTENQLSASIDREFIMRTADLEIDSGQFNPKPGDRIFELESGNEFEAAYQTGKQCFRYSNPGKTLVRVFTKKVK